MQPQLSMTLRDWMELYGTPDAPSPDVTGWKGFSHPTRTQWKQLWRDARKSKQEVEPKASIEAAMDLVERLRTQPPRLGPSASTDMLRDEAATEIERLRAKVALQDEVIKAQSRFMHPSASGSYSD